MSQKVCLTIAGLDPSGGAGTVADIKTFEAFGCYAAAVVASITFQNTVAVFGSSDQPADIVRRQIEPVLDDLHPAAVKTGMLPTKEVIEEVARQISHYGLTNVVVDPVVRSTSGFDLIDDNALQALKSVLFPIASIVTPNIPETERISGVKITSEADIAEAAERILAMGAGSALIKGGHLELSGGGDEERMAKDFLFTPEGSEVFEAKFIETTATHGTGCTLAAAIAARLALGDSLSNAVAAAKDFVTEAIRTAPMLGNGHSPINIRPVAVG